MEKTFWYKGKKHFYSNPDDLLKMLQPTISATTTATIIGMDKPRFQAGLEKGIYPFAYEVSLPCEERKQYKVVTAQLVNFLKGEGA